MSKIINGDNLTLGTCYYPEHWPKTMWREDLERMKKTGIEVIRIAEFAWSKIEPEEGVFTYEFFDEFLDLADEVGMKVIFCTPTATPPAWLTEKYPEVLNARMDGVLLRHGARRHYNYNSPVYQELSARITGKSASHYAKRDCIIGWQLDNEINCEVDVFYSESDTIAFRRFLKEKYGTIDALNEAWGTAFWNQTYTDWKEVYVPRTTISDSTNPHEVLDYTRFISASARQFAKMQSDIIRRYLKPGDFITTNGLFGNLDNHTMRRESLDFMTYDSYPNFAYCLDMYSDNPKNLRDRKWSRNLTETRSVSPVFGIMEQQSGANGWTTRMEAPTPRPGQLELWAMQSVAHGADYISFFRWRTCTFGTEIYWHGILDYDNRDNRKLSEVKEFYRRLKKLDPLCGSAYTAAFGLLKDYDNAWDTNVDVWHRRMIEASEEEIFQAAQRTHTPYDHVYLRKNTKLEELAEYPVLFYPHPTIMTQERADLLKAYVEQGGTLIIGCRSGYKKENGQCVMLPQPGLLKPLTGSDVREFTFASPAEPAVYARWEDGMESEMPIYHDVMEIAQGVENAKVLAYYTGSFYAGRPAVIEKKTGKGRAIHYGSTFSRTNVKQLLSYTGVLAPFEEILSAPEEVEVICREKDVRKFYFLLNYLPEEKTVVLHEKMQNLYDDALAEGEFVLKPYGTAVFTAQTRSAD